MRLDVARKKLNWWQNYAYYNKLSFETISLASKIILRIYVANSVAKYVSSASLLLLETTGKRVLFKFSI